MALEGCLRVLIGYSLQDLHGFRDLVGTRRLSELLRVALRAIIHHLTRIHNLLSWEKWLICVETVI
jgi:hypothetical protein